MEQWVAVLDPLRGVAAVAVVVHHCAQAAGIAYEGSSALSKILEWLGPWGVTLFFVLSGFCIHLPQAQKFVDNPSHQIDWAGFAKRRARRLLPTHYAALVLAAITGFFIQSSLITRPSIAAMVTHTFMVHVWYPPLFLSINAVFWTIAVEVHFYACYPIFLKLRHRFGSPQVTVGLFVVGFAIFALVSKIVHGGGVSYYAWQRLFVIS